MEEKDFKVEEFFFFFKLLHQHDVIYVTCHNFILSRVLNLVVLNLSTDLVDGKKVRMSI